MGINLIFDKFVSNLIIYSAYTLMIFTWYYFFYNSGNQISFLLFYPYGIIILAFLFFGNRIIIGLVLSYISLFFALKNYNLHLPFNNFFVMSASQLLCVPLTLFVFQKFNITVGAGKKYRLDKTNIYHVLLICFLSAILNGILIVFYSLFFTSQVNLFFLTMGCFFGSTVLIVSAKLLVNIFYNFTNSFKAN